ncbi:hypothetical protein SCLCIDRAFT_1218917 [Scleroderma citrinum Foug A]|uniref:Uncharacterized protein n=1 Tax=Scleroderma citrinum Foug A TaxID=1036808 RepID=A0A0C3DPP3_9AGAM|nr:hypothetical protein SCLCIDRAFT_1218917 [Scleroderma citrinum Foug A]
MTLPEGLQPRLFHRVLSLIDFPLLVTFSLVQTIVRVRHIPDNNFRCRVLQDVECIVRDTGTSQHVFAGLVV